TNRSKTPWVAVLLSTGAAFLTVIVNYYAPAKVFKFLIDSSGASMPDCRHTLHIFSKPSTFYKAALKTPFSAVIFSLSALRTERRT
ncbi:hypothetical protein MJO10_30170, partial [Salmonella enterica subsp. enterica serovar Anatum]|nr:hypothetical protein [Salmonella enterica subsp. enterica serovar Anatum]